MCESQSVYTSESSFAHAPSFVADFVVGLLATWMAGGIAVPMHFKHPMEELQYYADNSESSLVITSPDQVHE